MKTRLLQRLPLKLTALKSHCVRIQALALLTLSATATSVSATTIWYFMGAEEGRIYAVTPHSDDDSTQWWYKGALRFYWYQEDGGTTWRDDHGTGSDGNGSEIHGESWSDQAEHLFYNGDGEFYTVRRGDGGSRPDGTLRLLRDRSRNGDTDWEDGGAVGPPGVNWADYLWVLGGDEGRIYAVDCHGDLLFYHHTNNPAAGRGWAYAGVGQKIGSGWKEFRQVFSGRRGVIYAIDHAGTLFYYRDLARDGTANWHNGGTRVQIGPGWNRFQQVFSTGNDKIYGVDKNGQMFFYHITISGTVATCVDCGKPTRPGVEPLVPVPPELKLEPLTPLLKTGIYCWPLSAAPGEVIEFKISGVTTNVDFFRHWSTSADVVDELKDSRRVTSDFQPLYHVPARHGCGWSTTLALTVPLDWESGMYSAQCRFAGETNEQDIAFVVKPRPDRRSGLAVIANVNTWLAYNGHWGGNKYGSRANCSFLRPNPGASPSTSGLKHLARGELWILGWLQQIGIVPDVYTDIDFHQGLVAPQAHCLILSTHPEYWSTNMYVGLKGFLDRGGSLLYLGANGIFERAEYSCDYTAMKFLNGIEAQSRDYSLFRDMSSPLPSERSLLGVATAACDATGAPYQIMPVREPTETLDEWEGRQHRFVRGLSGMVGTSGYNTGDGNFVDLGMAAGWELDRSFDPGASEVILGNCDNIGCSGGTPRPLTAEETPAGLVVLARATSPLRDATGGCHPAAQASAEMTYYDHPGGGFVFSVGSITFGGSLVKDPGLQHIVSNALAQCHSPVPCPDNFLVNGSFEEPAVPDGFLAVLTGESTLPGWRVAAGSIDYHLTRASGTFDPVGSGPVAHGLHAVDLAGGPLGGILEQTFSTDPGQTYVLTFAHGTSQERGRSGRATLRVSVAGVSRTLVSFHPTPELAWDRHRVVFRAVSTFSAVRFTTGDQNDTSFCELDDVRVVSCGCNPDLAINGSFEIPGIPDGYVSLPAGSELVTGWTVVGSGVEYFNVGLGGPAYPVSTGLAADGLYAIDLASVSGPGGIQTTIPTVPGERYHVRFAIGTSQERGRTGNTALTASAPGVSHEFTLDTASATAVWERREFQFFANAPSSTLRFETHASPDTSFALLDDVQIHAVCPEPERANLLIPSREVWRYLDDGSDQGTSWRAPGFAATNWLTGAARFGFAGAGVATALTPGHVTYYFRHEFTVTNVAGISSLQVRLKRDDGAVVYLNGSEVFRSNMPTDAVGFLTFASSATSGADESNEFLSPVLPGSLLVDGTNVVAVEVHQAGTNDSDLGFDLELEATPQPDLPGIVQQPQSQTVIEGDPLTLSVIAMGTPPLFYQWSRDGVAIAGATNFILTIPQTTTNDAGDYTVVVSNPALPDGVLSSNAVVTIGDSCPIVFCPLNIATNCTGPGGTVVTYSPTGGNPCNPTDFEIVCAPPSGSVFPPGTTTVHCLGRAPRAGRQAPCDFIVTVAPCCVSPPSDLALWLPFDETSGNVAYNRASPLNNGDLYEGLNPATEGTGPAHQLGSYVNHSLHFDGRNDECCFDWVRVPDYPAINVGTGDFSLDAWIAMDPTNGFYAMIAGKYNSAPMGYTGFIFGTRAQRLLLRVFHDNTATDHLDTQLIPADGSWHFVAVTVRRDQPNGVQFYVDGAPTSTSDPGGHRGNLSIDGPLGVGGDKSRNWQWAGRIDEVGMFRRALEPAEILSLYDAGSAGKCPSCAPDTADLVAWWRAEGNAFDAVDSHHGTLQSGAGFAAGKVGQAFSFDGSGGFVSVPDSPAWDLGPTFTIEFWTKLHEIKRSMFIHQQSGDGLGGFEFDLQPGVGLVFALNQSDGFVRPWTPSPVVDTWYHLAVTRQADGYRLYVNGIQMGDVDPSADPVTDRTGPLRIGSYAAQSEYNVNGLIDELSIHERALSAAELLAIVNAGSAGKCPPPCVEIHCSTNVIAYACGSNCVPVDFGVWAENHCNPGEVSVTTYPPSGTCFPLGVHTVDAWASSSGETRYCSFTVTVLPDPHCQPTNCLAITCPSNFRLPCASLDGTPVDYTAHATNDCNPGDLIIRCDPPSGHLFQPGRTTVLCEAIGSGQTNTCTFTVEILRILPLHIVPFSPDKFRLYWQRSCQEPILEQSPTLSKPVWRRVPEPVQTLGDEEFAIVPHHLGDPAMFFRLRPADPGDLVLAQDQIAIVAAEGASSNALAGVAVAYNLTPLRELPGSVFLYALPQRTDRAALKTLLEAIRQHDPQLIKQAGLVAKPVGAELPMIVTDEFVVQFRQDVDRAAIDALNAPHPVEVIFENPFWKNHFLLRATAASTADAMEMSLRYAQSALVEYAEPNYVMFREFRATIPNDPLFGSQWHLNNTGLGGGTPDADIDAPEAWDITMGSAGVVIAVIDGGFDVAHPDLAPNLWVNSGEIPGNGLDDDGNMLRDDINGWDFAGNDNNLAGAPHGTSVAGCAGARGDNLLGVSGSCPRCRLMLIRGGVVTTPMSNATEFDYARNEGAHIITCSWGYPVGTPATMSVVNAINNAATLGRGGLGAVVLFAMNNRNVNDCGAVPDISSLPSVIAVSRSNNRDRFDLSGFGNCMDVLAPSFSPFNGIGSLAIATTDIQDAAGYNFNTPPPGVCPGETGDPNYTSCFNGTSAATPITAGIVGLILSVNPDLTRDQVQRLLQDTCDKIENSAGNYSTTTGFSSPPGGVATHGYGRVNAFEAVRVVAAPAERGRGGVDIFLRDNRLDWGNTEQPSYTLFEPTRGYIEHYVSVDIKVDAPPFDLPAPTTSAEFDAFPDENPEAATVNRVYVRVHNRGPVPADLATVQLHWAYAGAGLPALPADFWDLFPGYSSDTSRWHPLGTFLVTGLGYSGTSVAGSAADAAQIVQFDFPAPALDLTVEDETSRRHHCLFAVIDSPQDRVSPASRASLVPDDITPNDNNVTHRNVILQDPTGGGERSERFYARNPYDHDITTRLMVAGPTNLPVTLTPTPLGQWFLLPAHAEVLFTAQFNVLDTNASGRVNVFQEWLDENLPRVLGGLAFDFVRGQNPSSNRVCIGFQDKPPGEYPQPLLLGDLTFQVERGFPGALARVLPGSGGGPNVLDAGFETVIQFARPCRVVWLEVIPSGSAMEAQAFDSGGIGVALAGPVGPDPGMLRTLELRAIGIVRVHLKAPLNQSYLQRVCYEE